MIPTPRSIINTLKVYVPGRSIEAVAEEFGLEDVVKLASNENALGFPIQDEAFFRSVIASLHYYPDAAACSLAGLLSSTLSVANDQIILGNGSDEILQMIAMAYLNPGEEVISSKVTFSEYEFVTKLMDGRFVEVPVSGYGYDLAAILSAVTPKTKLIFIANPNNPTGTIITKPEMAAFMANVPDRVMVILDEAYFDYVEDPDFAGGIDLLSTYRNLIVLRTFSKIFGLAGLRIGLGVADASIIQVLSKVRQPFNVNSVAIKAAEWMLTYGQTYIKKSREMNHSGKHYFYAELEAMGLQYVKTEANFVLIETGFSAKVIFDRLLVAGVIVRPLESFGLSHAIRVTIGTAEQNHRFFIAFKTILKDLA